MKKIATGFSFCFVIIALLLSHSAYAQYSVDNPIVINSFPHIETNVNTDDGVTATGMQGACPNLPCCSTYVYKVVLPSAGALRVTMENFTPLANSLIAYYSTVSNPSSFSDLTYVSAAIGNFCGFRDTCQLGRGFRGWESGSVGNRNLVPTAFEAVYDFNAPSTQAGYFPAGDYYLLVFTGNQQAGNLGVGGVHDLVFEFAEACSPLTAPSSINFDAVEFNGQSDTAEFYVKNNRSEDVVLDISAIAISGTNAAEFSLLTVPTDSNLAVGDSALIKVISSPAAAGSRTASIDIPFNDTVCSATTSITLNGAGTEPEIKVLGNGNSINNNDASPSTADLTDFGAIVSNTFSVTRTFSIVNEGTDTLELSASPLVSISGSSQFSLQSSPNANILPGDTASFSITFTPTADGFHTATVSIANNDANENPFTFTITGEGAARNALHFDGSNDYVSINGVASEMAGVSGWTIESWINADNTQSGNDHILAVNTTGTGTILLFRVDDGVLSLYDGSNSSLATGIDLRDDQWHHVAISYASGELKMYIDGQLYATHAAGTINFGTTNRWSLGQEFDGSSRSEFFKGALNEVRIWKTVKSAQQIADNRYCEVMNPESDSNLVGYYTANQGTAAGTNTSINTLNDLSGNDFDGTLNSFALTGSTSNFISATNVGVNCNSISVQVCDAASYSSPAGNTYTSSGVYIDTLSKSAGGDSIVYIDLALNYKAYAQSNISDTTACTGDTVKGSMSTNLASSMNFVKSNSEWVALDNVEDSLINTNRSVFMWMRAAGQISGSQQVLLGINTSGSGTVTNFGIATNEQLWINDGGNNRNSGVVVTDGKWHFVGYTYNEGSNLTTFYVDGVAANTFSNGQSISATSRVSIGQEFDSSTPSNFFDGEITEVSIWKEVLDTNDVKQIMNAAINNTHNKYSSLVSYYPANALCNDGVKMLRDYSGNNLHGSLSTSSIVNKDSLVAISSFDATGHFSFNVNHNGSSVGSDNPYAFSYASSGAYVATLSKDFFAVVDTFNVTDGSSCTPSLTVSVVVDSNVSCNGFLDGGLTASPSGGTAPYTYLWSNGATTASITGLTAGTYSVTVTSVDSVSGMSSATVSQPASLNLVITVNSNASSAVASDGAVEATVTGGSTPYTYAWSNSGTTATLTGLAPGSYSLTVTDGNGCTTSGTTTITEPVAPTIVITEISYNPPESGADTTEFIELYNYGNIAIDLTGYSFTSGVVYTFPNVSIAAESYLVVAGDSVAMQNRFGVSSVLQWQSGGLSNGGEPIALRSGSGEFIDSLRYDDNSPWPIEADGDGYTIVLCDHTSDNTDGANWSLSGNQVSGLLINGKSVFGSPGSADSGCVNVPVLSLVVDSNVSCNGFSDGGATASTSGGTAPYTYAWSNSATTASITGVVAGTYTVTVTDSSGLTDTDSITITEPAALAASAVVDNNETCLSKGAATASASGGTAPYAYLWDNGDTTASITGVDAGMYSVTITDGNGCSDTASITITSQTKPIADFTSSPNTGSSIPHLVTFMDQSTLPDTWLWSFGDGNSSTLQNPIHSYTTFGTFTVQLTITDTVTGCSDTASTSVTINSFSASAVVDSNVSCNGFSDGGATASGSGGTAPYTYSWSNNATTASITGVTAGTYTVTVTDNLGATATDSITITEPAVLNAASIVDSNASCNGFLDGGATASGTGGTAPYTYLWSNTATTASITGVAAGTYNVTITDANGCTATSSTTITEPAVLNAASIVDSNASCNGFLDGGATASGTGGTAPYTYLWSNTATTASITGVAAGTYNVTITDANGCTATSSATITQPLALSIDSISTVNPSCSGGNDGSATVNVSGGQSPYTYSWNDGSNTTNGNTSLSAGTYTLTVTDANGCTIQQSNVILTEPVGLSGGTVSGKKP